MESILNLLERLRNSQESEFENILSQALIDANPSSTLLRDYLSESLIYMRISLNLWERVISVLPSLFSINEFMLLLDQIVKCIQNRYQEKDEEIIKFCRKLVIHENGEIRMLGRKLWDSYKVSKGDVEPLEFPPEDQVRLIISLSQDILNPEIRLPMLLQFFNSESETIRKILLMGLFEYTLNYFGVVKELFNSNRFLSSDESVLFTHFLNNGEKRFKLGDSAKELHSEYMMPDVYEECQRAEREMMKSVYREASANHTNWLSQLFTRVALARGGGFRREDGSVQPLGHVKVEKLMPMMASSKTPLEESSYFHKLLKNWSKEETL